MYKQKIGISIASKYKTSLNEVLEIIKKVVYKYIGNIYISIFIYI